MIPYNSIWWILASREIIKIKKKMEHKLEKYNMSYSKYSNWPSCDSSDWMTRYWGKVQIKTFTGILNNHGYNGILDYRGYIIAGLGIRRYFPWKRIHVHFHFLPGENYPRLLAIKATWDPGNVFNHCQVLNVKLSCFLMFSIWFLFSQSRVWGAQTTPAARSLWTDLRDLLLRDSTAENFLSSFLFMCNWWSLLVTL